MLPQTSIRKYDLLGDWSCVLIGAWSSLWETGIGEMAIRKCTARGEKPEWGIYVASWRAETGPDLWESRRNKSSAENSFTVRAGGARFYGFRISRLRFHPATTAARFDTATTRSNISVIASSRSPYQRQCEKEVSEIASIMAELETRLLSSCAGCVRITRFLALPFLGDLQFSERLYSTLRRNSYSSVIIIFLILF